MCKLERICHTTSSGQKFPPKSEKWHVWNFDKINTEDHCQFIGATKKGMSNNVGNLKEVMKANNVTFDKTDSISKITSKPVLPEKAAEELLDIRNISENIYKEFYSEWLKGDKTISYHMKKNLPTYTVSKKITKVKFEGSVIVLKEDRKMKIRFLTCVQKKTQSEPWKVNRPIQVFSTLKFSVHKWW